MKKLLFTIIVCLLSLSLLSQSCLPEGITFNTQEQIDNFQIDNPGCTEIEGDVTIEGSDITNLNGLNVLTSIGGRVHIDNNPLLNNLTGLENLTTINGAFLIGAWHLGNSGNLLLSSLTGLDNLTFIGEDLYITENNALINLEGLSSLSYLGGSLLIDGNTSLVSLTGLENLTNINGAVQIGTSQSEEHNGNPLLTNLTGLDNLTSVGGFLQIKLNSGLNNLTGLGSLEDIGGDFLLDGNHTLTDISSLVNLNSIGGTLVISKNFALITLAGLENLNAATIENLSILDNSLLATCEAQSVCNYLAAPGGGVYISDNAEGCNSQEEVEEACAIVAINEVSFEDNIITSPNPFTTSTTIEYELQQPERVSLSIYNHMGQIVYQTQENQAQGGQQLIWNAEGYAEGIYYYRLQVGDAIANGKMVKVR